MPTAPKVIKVSELIKRKAQIKKHFEYRWGCKLNSKKAVSLGANEYLGNEIYNDGLQALARIDEINYIINIAKKLK